MNSIGALLQAAEYLERRERGKLKIGTKLEKKSGILKILHFSNSEVEHGYASSLPGPFGLDESSFTQTSSLKLASSLDSGINNHPSNYTSRRLNKSNNNRKPQGNR